jgi:hypothetical protein
MIQQTSIQSFIELNKNILSHNQERVYRAVKELRSASDSEICFFLGEEDKNVVRPRRFELVEFGLIAEDVKRKCSITGKTVISWKVLE